MKTRELIKKSGSMMLLSVLLFMFSPLNAFAFSGETKKDAVSYIEKSLSDPQIKKWVVKKFVSEKLFLMAVKIAPEKTTLEIANTFSDFKQVGGSLEKAAEVALWVYVIGGIVVLILILSL